MFKRLNKRLNKRLQKLKLSYQNMNKARTKILKENKQKMKTTKFMNLSLKIIKIFLRVRIHKKIMKYLKKEQRKRMTLRKRKL